MSTLIDRRGAVSPPNLGLSYREPLNFVRAEKHFLYTESGERFLDGYNNVPHVGHAHPHVVDAVCRQMSQINTNTRYLQRIHIEYAERLLSLLPDPLNRVLFVSSASEANELALRLTRVATGHRDTLVMDHGYHGSTTGAMAISPYKHREFPAAYRKPDWVHLVDQPDLYRGRYRSSDASQAYASDAGRLVEELVASGRPPAAFICECLPSVGGQLVLPDGYLKAVYGKVREAGGLCVADDVQTALGRLGQWFWGFEQQHAVPDLVVLGKPLGNGFPLAAVAMTDEVAEAFAEGPEFFSTFGGSSAACAAGMAVLEVLQTEPLQANAASCGEKLLAGLRQLKQRYDCIGDVRGSGLFLGADLVSDPERRTPAAALADTVVNGLRDRRILIGVDGPHHNVLKIRPPMTFDKEAADALLTALDETLAAAGE